MLASAFALSCNVTAGAGTTTTEEGTAPAAAPHVVAAPAKLPLHAGDLESTGQPPSSEMVVKTNALAARLGSAIGQSDTAHIAFVSCEQEPCSARVSAANLASLGQALQGISQDQAGRIGFVARERLDPYQGQSFEADVTVDTDEARAVPADPAELLSEDMP